MEKEETYVPKTRTTLGIPAKATEHDIKELLEDTPIYTLLMLILQQTFAFHAYMSPYRQVFYIEHSSLSFIQYIMSPATAESGTLSGRITSRVSDSILV